MRVKHVLHPLAPLDRTASEHRRVLGNKINTYPLERIKLYNACLFGFKSALSPREYEVVALTIKRTNSRSTSIHLSRKVIVISSPIGSAIKVIK